MISATLAKWRLWYDDQCEVCQAGVAWLRWLDRLGRVEAIPLSSDLSNDRAPPPNVTMEALLSHLHVLTATGDLLTGAPAVACLAKLFPITWFIGFVASLPGFSIAARALYNWLASNRYSLSRCRGGACQSARVDILANTARRAFRVCHVLGWAAITPLSCAAYLGRLARQYRTWRTTRGRVLDLLQGRLTIFFLRGGISWTVSLLFGELFTAIRYESLLVDPGGTRMKRAMLRQLKRHRHKPRIAIPTHAHEEHCGNLEWLARTTGARVLAAPAAVPLVKNPLVIPIMRRLVIGQPEAVTAVEELRPSLRLEGGTEVVVIPTPGHCAEHISLFIPSEKLLIAGDAFMGTHFSSPNDQVDHHAWIGALDRMLKLDIEIMVEAHGHVHTLRADVLQEIENAGLAHIASRRSPQELLQSKLQFIRWTNQQIELGRCEGLPLQGLQATIFPWTQRWSYETWIQDSIASLVSGHAFGRHRVIRSFRPPPTQTSELPNVFELRWIDEGLGPDSHPLTIRTARPSSGSG